MKIFFICIIGIAGLVAYVRFIEATTVFLPSRQILATPKEVGLAYEDVFFQSPGYVPLNGWFVPAGDSPEKRSTLLFFHGNAGNIGDRIGKIALFHQMGLNVFIFDYRGYGNSQGSSSEKTMYLDAQAAYDYLIAREDVDRERIISYGVSLGGAAAVDLAVHRDIACLVLDSTFTSAADMGKIILPIIPSFLLNIKLDSVSKIKDIEAPKLFIHSIDDEMIPFALGRRLYFAASDPKDFLEINGGHNDNVAVSQRAFTGGVKAFLRKYNFIR
ncbi:MAG: alpha/beta hydrolase [Candidatus Omnitrophica bacterium]|nr:alpha/beta hydrolase [Candidatus Omnitrophota bacterium]